MSLIQTTDVSRALQRQYRLQTLPDATLAPEVVPVVLVDELSTPNPWNRPNERSCSAYFFNQAGWAAGQIMEIVMVCPVDTIVDSVIFHSTNAAQDCFVMAHWSEVDLPTGTGLVYGRILDRRQPGPAGAVGTVGASAAVLMPKFVASPGVQSSGAPVLFRQQIPGANNPDVDLPLGIYVPGFGRGIGPYNDIPLNTAGARRGTSTLLFVMQRNSNVPVGIVVRFREILYPG